MEPKRMLVVTPVSTERGPLRQGESVWMLEEPGEDGVAVVEVRGRPAEVPAASLTPTPVPPPDERLAALDPCFSRGPSALREIHVDKERLFTVFECEHGHLFLEDTVTGIGWTSRLLFMGDVERDPERYLDFWRRHHPLSTDQIRLRGLGR